MLDMQDVTILWLPGGVTGYVDVNKDGTLCIGVGWYSDEGINLVMERDYGVDGKLKEVRSKSEVVWSAAQTYRKEIQYEQPGIVHDFGRGCVRTEGVWSAPNTYVTNIPNICQMVHDGWMVCERVWSGPQTYRGHNIEYGHPAPSLEEGTFRGKGQ
ncbi:hypothetical protein L1049_018414 [Liquidambar formosana]|uniref:Uncharacterized protein n=1 Tax=Liquidambar formosana TaxID=63359 RepID=A0AAP0RA19_LIQFO